MKKIILCLIFIIFITGCHKNKYVGTWIYRHVSSVNGGVNIVEFTIDSDNKCHYNMRYIYKNKDLINLTSYCTWKEEDDKFVYDTNGTISYMYYDKSEDKLYSIDKKTNQRDWAFIRK